MPPNPRTEPSHMDVDAGIAGAGEGEGLRTYYITKIEELMLTVTDKRMDVRRLQVKTNLTLLALSQNNELGFFTCLLLIFYILMLTFRLSGMSSMPR